MKNTILSVCMFFIVIITISPQNFQWAVTYAGTGGDVGHSIAVDQYGNVYTTGEFGGSIDFDPGPGVYNMVGYGSSDIFISKLDPTGNFVWAKRIGGTDGDAGHGISIDPSGNICVTGYFTDSVDFDPGMGEYNLHSSSAGLSDIFIAKFNPNGDLIWANPVGGTPGNDIGLGIDTDGMGNVYVTGKFSGPADFDPGPGSVIVTGPGGDVFITKFDMNGNLVWAEAIAGTASQTGYCISVDNLSNVYVAGEFYNTADFDPGPAVYNLSSLISSYCDIFVTKLDINGNLVWAKQMSGTYNEVALGIDVDPFGNVYTTGTFRGTTDFNPGPGTNNLSSFGFPLANDIFISKLNSNGNYVWAKRMGVGGNDFGFGLHLDDSIHVYTTGYFNANVDFDPGPGTFNISSAGNEDAYISKLDSSGNFIMAKAIGGSLGEQGRSITADNFGNVYSTGAFQGTCDFDPGPSVYNLSGLAFQDAYVHKLGWCFPSLTPDTILGDLVACANSFNVYSVDLDSSISVYNWILPPGWTGTSTANTINVFTGDSSGVITVMGNNLCGYTPAQYVAVSVINPLSGVNIVGLNNICTGGNYTYTLFPTDTGYSYNWILPVGWIGSSMNDSITITPNDTSGILTLVVNHFCGSDTLIRTIDVINSVPVFSNTINGLDTICPGIVNLYSIDTANNASSYNWVLPSGWLGASNTDSILVISDLNSGLILVTANNLCGSSLPESLFVNVQTIDTSVAISGATLMSNMIGASYQWMNCTTDSIIPGQTNQTYVPNVNGLYAVIINSQGCIDTSACYLINSVGLNQSNPDEMVSVFPNPSNGLFLVYTNDMVNTMLDVYNVLGEKVQYIQSHASGVDLSSLKPGVYYLKVTVSNHSTIKKIILEK